VSDDGRLTIRAGSGVLRHGRSHALFPSSQGAGSCTGRLAEAGAAREGDARHTVGII